MLPELPLEFIVPGIAVSFQAKRPSTRANWQETVRQAATEVLPEGHFALEIPLAVTIYFFPQSEMQADIDNCAKPIFDAMKKFVYVDDKQVERIVLQKFEPERPIEIDDEPTASLSAALTASDPIVYIKIHGDPRGE